MQSPAAVPTHPPLTRPAAAPPDPAAARRWLWRALIILTVGGWAGGTWDSIWHATEPFDGFWSPPHLVVYATVALVSFIVMGLVFTPRLRDVFGATVDVKILPFRVPGALVILGGGLVLLGFAGAVLDNAWHTAFGLNETSWSFPHAMIGWSLVVVGFGFVACRQALEPHKPTPWITRVLLGALLINLLLAFTGPLTANRTPNAVDFYFTNIPALASQESAQAVYRIYDTHNLNRTHPALIVLLPLWLGAAVGLLRAWERRGWVVLLTVAVFWLLDVGNRATEDLITQYLPQYADPRNLNALPVVLPTLLIVLLPQIKLSERVRYSAAGILCALMVYDIWSPADSPAWLLALLAPPLTLWGKRFGDRLYAALAAPGSWRSILTLTLPAVIVPLLTGAIDLLLRLTTP